MAGDEKRLVPRPRRRRRKLGPAARRWSERKKGERMRNEVVGERREGVGTVQRIAEAHMVKCASLKVTRGAFG